MSKNKLTRARLAKAIQHATGLPYHEALEFVRVFFETIMESLERGDSVKLSSFGVFSVRDKARRIGRNPRTGEEKIITARRVVGFKSSQALKTKVNKSLSRKNG